MHSGSLTKILWHVNSPLFWISFTEPLQISDPDVIAVANGRGQDDRTSLEFTCPHHDHTFQGGGASYRLRVISQEYMQQYASFREPESVVESKIVYAH